MNNDKIGANAGKLKGRELRPLISCIFFFRLIQAIKDVLTEINLACTPNPILLRGLSLSQCPLHSDIHLHLFAYGPFHLLGHGIQHYIVLPHYSHNKTRKHISKHQSLTRTLSLCRCKIPNNWNNGVPTFGPVNFQKQYFSFRWGSELAGKYLKITYEWQSTCGLHSPNFALLFPHCSLKASLF